MEKSKIKNQKIVLYVLMILLVLSSWSCSKMEDDVKNELNKNSSPNTNARIKNNAIDSFEYYINLDCPTKDAVAFVKSGGILSATKAIKIGNTEIPPQTTVGGPIYPNYHCCNGICLTIPEDPYGYYAPFTDVWNNPISYIGQYGNDARQMYYVFTPTNINNDSKIVVLIHGGGWITGPDPDVINGWSPAFAPTPTSNQQQNNLVKNLLSQGYVVVSLLYRLASYGDNGADISASPVTVLDQINDIDAAITHIHTNFPICLLQIDANNIQIIGESAGANLALMYAYTKANTSYIKSVISVAGPTNINQYANFLNTKSSIHPIISQACSNTNPFVFDNINATTFTHYPFYGIYDPTADAANMTVTGYTNPAGFSCQFSSINSPWTTVYIPANQNINKRRIDLYKLAQSVVGQVITNPLVNTKFTEISPCFNLVATRIIPTFIIHGTSDELVPYTKATDNMETSLSNVNLGGLIGKYNNTGKNLFGQNTAPLLPISIPPSSSYATTINKHIIKTYTGAGHGVSTMQMYSLMY